MTWEERQEKRLVWRDIRPWMGLMRCGRCGKLHAADLERGEMFEQCQDLIKELRDRDGGGHGETTNR